MITQQQQQQQPYQIIGASLRVAWDLGHGGTTSHYRIERVEDAFIVSLSVSRPFPRPGGGSTDSGAERNEVLRKETHEVLSFLDKLSSEYNVLSLTDRKSPYPFLHPKFYHFHFEDAQGNHHAFTYSIEANKHHHPEYHRLTKEFDLFFESERVFQSFSRHLDKDKR